MANVQFCIFVVLVLALLLVPSATTASESFNILSSPSHSLVDSKPAQGYEITSSPAPAPGPSYNKFDFFKLVMQWAPTHCKDFTPACKMTPLPQIFYIHGLWPDNLKGDSLNNCYNHPYVPITDRTLLASMNKIWLNVESGASNNPGIWRHQWEKHGTCSLIKYDQTAFFKKAVELHSQYDVIGKIRASMKPTANEMYQRSRLIQVLREITSKAPGISCISKSGKQTLHEVTFCFTPEGVVMDCPQDRISSKCTSTTFYFPGGIPAPAPPPPRVAGAFSI